MTFTIPAPPHWWPYLVLSAGALLLLIWLIRAGTLRQLATLWVKSFVENERFSPRLLTIFFFVLLTGYLEYRIFLLERAEAQMLVYVQVVFANLTLVTALLGAGKLADTYKTVQLEKKTPDTQITAKTAAVSGQNISVGTDATVSENPVNQAE